MTRTAKLFATLALALPAGALIAGCGDDGGEDPQAVLDAAFSNDAHTSSGVIDLSVTLSAEGDQGGSFEASLSGPFQGDPEDPNALPQLDLTATATGEGGGQTIDFEGGLVVTEDNAFIEYNGSTYEVGTDNFAQLKEGFESSTGTATETDAGASFTEGCAAAIEAQGGDPAACDFDISSWATDLTNEGTEDKGGAEATHVSGNLDLTAMLNDLVGLGLSLPQAEAQGLSPELIEGSLGIVEQAIDEASFDIYAATEDDSLRGLDFALGVDPTVIPGAAEAGISSLDLGFSFELSDVGSTQTIAAPTGETTPIDDLVGQIPGLEGLGGLGGLPGGGGIPEIPEIPGTGGGSTDDIAACFDEAKTTKEINACLGL